MAFKDLFNTGIGSTFDPQEAFVPGESETRVFEPWTNIQSAKDPFFPALNIEGQRWDRICPYRLLVIDVKNGNRIVGKGGSGPMSLQFDDTIARIGNQVGRVHLFDQVPMRKAWCYNFPISPQSISITDQYAINTVPTMRGVIEEHNGIKFKIINMSGTTGIWPNKKEVAGLPETPSILGTAFGNTLEKFDNLSKQAGRLASQFSGGNKSKASNLKDLTESGYYQALLLGQFLERYAMAKKDPKNKHWRLVIDIQKENQAFIVTPLGFSLQKSQQSPMEYMWSLQLKAWKRIELFAKVEDPPPPITLTPNALQRISRAIRDTRRTLSEASNLVKAVRADFAAPFESLRQASLAVKDLGGFVNSVADLPNNIIADCKSSIQQASENLKQAFVKERELAKVQNIRNENKTNEGVSSEFTRDTFGPLAADRQQLSSTSSIFNEPESNFEFLDAINVSDLKLTPQQSQALEDALSKAALITIDDLKRIRLDLLTLGLDISNNFGAGSDVYSEVYSRPSPKKRITPMTLEEYDIVNSIYESIQSIDILTATKEVDDIKTQNPLEYVGGLANDSGIDFELSTSKYLAPVPFGLSIEEISARYLGSTDRWIEIATLNNLRSPYIDEEGFTYNFLSNASGRQFNVNDSGQMLFIGQRILIRSDIVANFSRKIISIEKISDTNYLISVDGEANLDNLLLSENAKLQAYLPGTVNSQDQIYIPSNLPAQEDDRVNQIPAFRNDKLTRISKVDWLLDDNGDLAINNSGDIRLANGLNNLVQALKIKISVKKNSLLRHPDFGVRISAGDPIADLTSGEIFNDLNKVITDDPRFSGLERLRVKIEGAKVSIDIAVSIANGSGIIPISFSV